MNKLLLLIFLVLNSTSCKSQNAIVQSDSSILGSEFLLVEDVEFIAIDKLKNIYVIDRLFALKKYDADFEYQYEYSKRNLGDIGHVDATNPLQLLVYYPDFQIVKILDVTLAETNTYDLTELDLTDVIAVGSSNDNGIWLYDETTARLKKLDAYGEFIIESSRLDLLIRDQTISPTQIFERDNLVFVFDPEYGVIVFDNFAQLNFISKDILGGTIQPYNKFIIHHNKRGLHVWDPAYKTSAVTTLNTKYLEADQIIHMKDKSLLRFGQKVYTLLLEE